MCGRFYIALDDPELEAIIAQAKNGSALKRGEIFPADCLAVITAQKQVCVMRWGFPRFDGRGLIINARSETVADRPAFRQALAQNRCLIAASNYFEWQKQENKKIKQAICLPDSKTLFLAGLYKHNNETGEPVFVILTRPAWPGIAFIHDRMPVILPPAVHEQWLGLANHKEVFSRAVNEVQFRTC